MAVTSIGYPFALNIISGPDQAVPTALRIPDSEKSDPNVQVHTGIAYSPDGNIALRSDRQCRRGQRPFCERLAPHCEDPVG